MPNSTYLLENENWEDKAHSYKRRYDCQFSSIRFRELSCMRVSHMMQDSVWMGNSKFKEWLSFWYEFLKSFSSRSLLVLLDNPAG